jgi:enoyl-CoA hydratase/carnithine racemase
MFQAMSVILFNTKLSAATAKQFGLVAEVLKTDQFDKDMKSNVQRLLSVPLQVRDCLYFVNIAEKFINICRHHTYPCAWLGADVVS